MTPTLYVLSLDEAQADRIGAAVPGTPVVWIDGSNAPSFSWLVNQAIRRERGEIVLCTSDRISPQPEHLRKLMSLLCDGYGFVGLYRWAFFGFQMDAVRRVGFLDEEMFPGGEYEDADWTLRACEADIAIYEAEEVPYQGGGSRWVNRATNEVVFKQKWWQDIPNKKLSRLLPDGSRAHDVAALGPVVGTHFRSWNEGVLLPGSAWTVGAEWL